MVAKDSSGDYKAIVEAMAASAKARGGSTASRRSHPSPPGDLILRPTPPAASDQPPTPETITPSKRWRRLCCPSAAIIIALLTASKLLIGLCLVSAVHHRCHQTELEEATAARALVRHGGVEPRLCIVTRVNQRLVHVANRISQQLDAVGPGPSPRLVEPARFPCPGPLVGEDCHQPVSSSTLPLSLPSALLPTLDWVTPAAYLSPETAVGHIPSSADQVDNFSAECCRLPVLALCPKSEQISSDPSFEVKFCAVVGQSLHTVAIGSCNDGEFEVRALEQEVTVWNADHPRFQRSPSPAKLGLGFPTPFAEDQAMRRRDLRRHILGGAVDERLRD
ncbi:hypothetical protein ZIOFF_043688 [Zingiber officinale]|uniref:Uncharacterized protein n=1 Tax=Zingiber officinale TaxID=94328 RepID=A0A8J5G4N5_ZINOF|nr:hypothetical protein ZIOFF_043688 [Zingiber officinale]